MYSESGWGEGDGKARLSTMSVGTFLYLLGYDDAKVFPSMSPLWYRQQTGDLGGAESYEAGFAAGLKDLAQDRRRQAAMAAADWERKALDGVLEELGLGMQLDVTA